MSRCPLRTIGRWTAPLLALLAFGASACAVDDMGFIAAEFTEGEGALVVDVYSLGGQLRTRSDDAGFTLGVQRRSYVFPRDAKDSPDPGWQFFWLSLPETEVVAIDTRILGLEVWTTSSEASLALGFKASTILARVPRDRSVAMMLAYTPDQPSQTRLKYCEEERECWDEF